MIVHVIQTNVSGQNAQNQNKKEKGSDHENENELSQVL